MTTNTRVIIDYVSSTIRESLGIYEGDFDIENIVSRLNGKIEYFSENITEEIIKGAWQESIKGYDESDISFTIRINENNVKTRQRFSIAHELGHLFLHMGYLKDDWNAIPVGEKYKRELGTYTAIEEEANEFAGAFLMPSSLFIEKAKKTASESYYNLDKIAEYFNVSVSAVLYRGRNLGLWR